MQTRVKNRSESCRVELENMKATLEKNKKGKTTDEDMNTILKTTMQKNEIPPLVQPVGTKQCTLHELRIFLREEFKSLTASTAIDSFYGMFPWHKKPQKADQRLWENTFIGGAVIDKCV